jgi:adenylate cyclase
MTPRLEVRVYQDGHLCHEDDFEGPLELGRQMPGERGPFTRRSEEGRCRLVIASAKETDVGKTHAFFMPVSETQVHLTNGSNTQPIWVHDHDPSQLLPGSSCEVPLPVVLTLGQKTVRVQRAPAAPPLHTLAEATVPPQLSPSSTRFPTLTAPDGSCIDSKEIVKWLYAAMDVLQAAADSADFFDRAAGAAVTMVDLDSARIFLLEHGQWQLQALQEATHTDPDSIPKPSRHVLHKVQQDRRTFWEVPTNQASLAEVQAVVAAPILDRQGEAIGVLYGERRRGGVAASRGAITEVEAMLVELLARGVAAGLARLEQERAALAERVRFDQFFSPELSRQLSAHPDLLEGRKTEVTVLFCDIRGFSRISQRLDPGATVKWVRNALSALSDCVRTEGGVLVDYIGDELMAMWGAPEEQPDHARRACRAALAMQDCLPELNRLWQPILQEPMEVGIGINTGLAQVGNTGSHLKFKYGPLGNTVNLASRVQGATKYLRCSLLITGETRRQLDESFALRRLGLVQVVNISDPVDLHELAAPTRASWADAKAEYERALKLFERKEFAAAARTMGNRRAQDPSDGPALMLLHRAVNCMVAGAAPCHPVWIFPDK